MTKERTKLEAERTKLLRKTLKGIATEDQYATESKRIDAEIRDLERLTPAPIAEALDPAKLIVRITRAFARFGRRSLEQQAGLAACCCSEYPPRRGLDHGVDAQRGVSRLYAECEFCTAVFAAVQEQLGLKLNATKGPVETIVVDRIDKLPTAN